MLEKGHAKVDPKSESQGVRDPRCMTLEHSNRTIGTILGVYNTYFWKLDFHISTRPRAAFPFSCMHEKEHATVDPKCKSN